jgi:small-conductance mechanosensitive channel
MPRQKKTAHVAEKMEHRLAGLRAINPNLDLGEGCSVVAIQETINQLREKVNAYNDALSVVDSTQIEIENLEKQLNQLSQKAMLGVAFKYGRNSNEYRLAGGTPTDEITRKAVATRLKAKAQEEFHSPTQI